MKWFENFLDGFLGSFTGTKIKRLDLTAVSKGMGEQLVNDQKRRAAATAPVEPESVLVNGKRVYNPRVVEAVKKSRHEAMEVRRYVVADPMRDYATEHKEHRDRYDEHGNFKVQWHTGIAVKGSGDVAQDIKDARDRLDAEIEEALGLGGHVTERMSEMEARHERRREEARQRRAAQAEEARKLAEAQAEAAELEAIGRMAVVEVDSRYSRF